jgi:hypothetical protein
MPKVGNIKDMHNVRIRSIAGTGHVTVHVGCTTVIFDDTQKLIDAFTKYVHDPMNYADSIQRNLNDERREKGIENLLPSVPEPQNPPQDEVLPNNSFTETGEF